MENDLQFHFEANSAYHDREQIPLDMDPEEWPQSFYFGYGSWDLIEKVVAPHIETYREVLLLRRYTKVEKNIEGDWERIETDNSIPDGNPCLYWDDLESYFDSCVDSGDFVGYPDDLIFFGETEEAWFYFWMDQDISDCGVAKMNKTCYYDWDEDHDIPIEITWEDWRSRFEPRWNPELPYKTKKVPEDFRYGINTTLD